MFLWTSEKLGGGGEGASDVVERDGVVFKVDKTGGLETVEDGLSGGKPFGGRAVEEDGEVNELVGW